MLHHDGVLTTITIFAPSDVASFHVGKAGMNGPYHSLIA
jgi:hypothetical protein